MKFISPYCDQFSETADLPDNGNQQKQGRQKLSAELDAKENRVTAIDLQEFLLQEFPPREKMLSPWLPMRGLAMVHGIRGLGKTLLCHGSAWAVAVGGGFWRWTAPEARRVLLLDGEMPASDLQARLRACQNASELRPGPGYFRVAAADTYKNGLPDLANSDAQEFYANEVADADLVVVDNLSTLCRSLQENDADSWAPVQAWILKLRRAGKSALLVHHDGKAGQQRGTSKKEDVLDSIVHLRRPPDYSAEQGARFEVHFTKSRGFHGPEAEPFEARLAGQEWLLGPIKAADDVESMRALKKQGLSIRDISERTGVPRSTIQRRLEGGDE